MKYYMGLVGLSILLFGGTAALDSCHEQALRVECFRTCKTGATYTHTGRSVECWCKEPRP